MMKDILCNTKWCGLYHMISSRSQATRGRQNTASKALWHFEVAELQSKWEAEMGKPPVLEGLWGLYSGKLCSRVETPLLMAMNTISLGKMGASNKQHKDMVHHHTFFQEGLSWTKGLDDWSVLFLYQPPRLCRILEWSTTKLKIWHLTFSYHTWQAKGCITMHFHHIPPKSSSPPLLHNFFHEHWGKRALGRVPTSRSRPQKGGPKKAQVFSQRIWNRLKWDHRYCPLQLSFLASFAISFWWVCNMWNLLPGHLWDHKIPELSAVFRRLPWGCP